MKSGVRRVVAAIVQAKPKPKQTDADVRTALSETVAVLQRRVVALEMQAGRRLEMEALCKTMHVY